MVIASCVLLALLAIGFAVAVREKDVPPAPIENPELKHLQDRRAVLFENLKDLQFEYHQGKLSDEDYQSLKLGFQNDLAVVLASIDMLRSKPPVAATEDAATAGADAASNPEGACPACHAANPSGHRFCGQCGAPLLV